METGYVVTGERLDKNCCEIYQGWESFVHICVMHKGCVITSERYDKNYCQIHQGWKKFVHTCVIHQNSFWGAQTWRRLCTKTIVKQYSKKERNEVYVIPWRVIIGMFCRLTKAHFRCTSCLGHDFWKMYYKTHTKIVHQNL